MKLHVTMPDLSQKETTFDELLEAATYTVLYFYPKDKTPGCTVQANEYTQFASEFAALDVQIIGVSKDTHTSHCSFMTKEGISFPLISDQDQTLHNDPKFSVWVEKSMYGKKYMGTLRSSFVLDKQGNVLQEWKKVKSRGNAKTVLEYIAGL